MTGKDEFVRLQKLLKHTRNELKKIDTYDGGLDSAINNARYFILMADRAIKLHIEYMESIGEMKK